VALGANETVRAEPRHYLNRLSDLLFVLARVLNRANLDGKGGDDVYWQSARLARDPDGRADRSHYGAHLSRHFGRDF